MISSLSVFCSHPQLNLLEQATLKQCVVGPNHAGFLLEVTFWCLCFFFNFFYYDYYQLMALEAAGNDALALFQDGRICRISFAVQPDRLELGKPDGNDG